VSSQPNQYGKDGRKNEEIVTASHVVKEPMTWVAQKLSWWSFLLRLLKTEMLTATVHGIEKVKVLFLKL
jgi:hypothetical protein